MDCHLKSDKQKEANMEIIYIHWLRQVKRYFRSRTRLFGSIVQPLLYLIALGFGLGPTFQNAGRGNYIQFLTPGVVGMIILFAAVFSGIDLIFDRRFGFLRATLVAPVSRLTIIAGRTLGGATVALIQGLLVFIFCFLVGFRPVSFMSIPLALLFMVLTALMFAALGTMVASLLTDFNGFQTFTNFLAMPLFFFSGALFPLAGVSKVMLFIARINAFSYGVDGLRAVLIGGSPPFGVAVDLTVMIILTAILMALGAYFFSKMQL
jgi:ABC-2 type transport system permease protein